MGLQRDIESAFVVRLKPVVEQVAKEKGVQVVLNLDDQTIVWADSSLDIAAEVVKQLARVEVPGNR